MDESSREAGQAPLQGAAGEDPTPEQVSLAARLDTRDPATSSTLKKCEGSVLIEDAFSIWKALTYNKLPAIARLFREATDADPRNPSGWAGLAHTLILQGVFGMLAVEEANGSANAAAKLALNLDPGCEVARCAIAWLKMLSERDWPGARGLFEDLLKGPHPSSRARAGRALLHVAEGQADQSAEAFTQLVHDFPLSTTWANLLCWTHYLRKDFDLANVHVERARYAGKADPALLFAESLLSLQCDTPAKAAVRLRSLLQEHTDNRVLQACLGYCEAVSGNVDEARAILQRLRRQVPSGRTPHYLIAIVLIGLKEYQDAHKALESAYALGTLSSLAFHADPLLEPLHKLPFAPSSNGPIPNSTSRKARVTHGNHQARKPASRLLPDRAG